MQCACYRDSIYIYITCTYYRYTKTPPCEYIITKHKAWLVDKTLNLEYYIYTIIMSWVIFGDSVTVASGGCIYD